jgi:uncharacterized membrane protein YraQ (UPF0718 family)
LKFNATKILYPAVFFTASLALLILPRLLFKEFVPKFDTFVTLFLSILLEAFPFLLLGTFLSSIIEIFVPASFIERIVPKNRILGILVASVVGLIFPLCECAIVPVTGRLMKKGVPVHVAITFMLAVPVINPLVIASTWFAFTDHHWFVFLRVGSGFVIAVIVGLVISFIYKNSSKILLPSYAASGNQSLCQDGNCSHENEEHFHDHGSQKVTGKVWHVLHHTIDEFFDIGRYFMIGALLSALFQTYLPRNILFVIGQNPVLSILVMFVFAFVLSVCSEADAFIARSFLGQFTNASILGFMVFGPMIDIKNTLMLRSRFNRQFVFILIMLIFAANFALSMIINYIPGG